MNWESKQKMCRLFNDGDGSEAVKLVAEAIDDMDNQAWDMFFYGISNFNTRKYI